MPGAQLSRAQCTSWSEADRMDDEEVMEGYRDGRAGESEPGHNRSYAYWHGWTKGALDGGFRARNAADDELARDYQRETAQQR